VAACWRNRRRGASRGQPPGDAGTCPLSHARPGADGNPGSGGKPLGRAFHPARSRADARDAAFRCLAGSDRRSFGEQIALESKKVVIVRGTAIGIRRSIP